MASVNLDVPVRKDWLLANPWAWLWGGIALTVWSWVWTAHYGPSASDNRIIVLAVGLLLAGVGVWLRHRDRATLYVRAWPPLALALRVGVGGLFALLALGVTVLLIATFFYRQDVDPAGDASAGVLTRVVDHCQRRFGLHTGVACLLWLSLVPLALGAARRCLRRKAGQEILEADEEIGLAFCVLAGCCLLGRLTLLRDPDDPADWDSMRLFLRVGALVCLYAAGLILVSTRLRRLVLSLLFVLHFAGISSACLSAPPGPVIVQQAWMRLFRPYLEFMYLNNAYHFYAPEPGPSSYVWFRVIFTDVDGNDVGLWYKLPEVDDQDRIKHPVALEYQRYLTMTETIAPILLPLPSEFVFNDVEKQWKPRPLYANRLSLAEPPGPVTPGKEKSKHFRIPLHPDILKTQQVNIPADGPSRFLASFARHIAHKYATHTDDLGRPLKFQSVKIYRVIHVIPPVGWFQKPLPATDPTLYRPFFVGNFLATGERVDDQDPYLFWLLPILRDNPLDPNSDIKDHARRHAGDPQWVRQAGRWEAPNRAW